jgi:hypothetical protein
MPVQEQFLEADFDCAVSAQKFSFVVVTFPSILCKDIQSGNFQCFGRQMDHLCCVLMLEQRLKPQPIPKK